jgi:hypothetical protein
MDIAIGAAALPLPPESATAGIAPPAWQLPEAAAFAC